MNPLSWRRRSASRPIVEAQLDEELAFHLEMSQRELEAQGAAPGEAEAAARRRFGDATQIRRQCLQIASGEQNMIKNILLAASLVVILTLSLMCVHFYNIARSARQEAIMQRLLLEQEMARAQSMSSFLQQLLVSADLRPTVRSSPTVIPYLEVANAYVGRTAFTPNLEMQLRAATQAVQPAHE